MNSSVRQRMKDLVPMGIAMAIAIAAATVAASRTGNREFTFYIVVLLLLMAAVAVVHIRTEFSRGLLWCLTVWAVVHLAGGLVAVPESWPIAGDIRVLYSWWLIPDRLKYDQVVHFYGFGITTWMCWQAIERTTPISRPTVGLLVLCAAAGAGFGALNEVVEFAATLLVEETNVGGYENTGWDLVANLAGCVAAAALIGVTEGGRDR